MPWPPVQMLHDVRDKTYYNRRHAKSRSRQILIVSFLISVPAVALIWIMLCLLLDMEPTKAKTTGWSRTPGGLAGERRATS